MSAACAHKYFGLYSLNGIFVYPDKQHADQLGPDTPIVGISTSYRGYQPYLPLPRWCELDRRNGTAVPTEASEGLT